jgi:hypothetical protein
VPSGPGVESLDEFAEFADQHAVAGAQELVEHFVRLADIRHIPLIAAIELTPQIPEPGALEPLTPRHNPLAVAVDEQPASGTEHIPEPPLRADDLMQMRAPSRRLCVGDLLEPAMDRPLIGEPAASGVLQGGVRAQERVAGGDPPQPAGESRQEGADPLRRCVAGGAVRDVPECHPGPGLQQVETPRHRQHFLRHHQAEPSALRWPHGPSLDNVHVCSLPV